MNKQTKPTIIAKPTNQTVTEKTTLSIVETAIQNWKETETTVPLHVVVRGAIATEYKLDVSQFTLLDLLKHLIDAVEEKDHTTLYKILFPLTTEYTNTTVGAEPWTHKDATRKLIDSLLETLK